MSRAFALIATSLDRTTESTNKAKMKKIVLFGLGMMGDIVYQHISRDAAYDVVAFTIDSKWLEAGGTSLAKPANLPVIAFEEIEKHYPPDRYAMFVAMGYHDLNRVRAEKCAEAKAKGYELVSYVSSRAHCGPWLDIGENCLVLDGAGIQPGTAIGNNVWLWNNCLVGHHASVGDHCWIAAGTTIGGKASIEERCFFGLGATVGGDIRIGADSFVGAGTLVTKEAAANSVFVQRDTDLYRLDSRSFLRITKLATLGSREG
jgi:sugar O-acyltransferase (sialic acid O-acetyltransferase NeuD family)